MCKNQLIARIYAETHIPRHIVEKVIDAFTDITAATITQGEQVMISGFGVFEAKSRCARIGRNPHTGEPVEIPARIMPSFKPAQSLKEKVSAPQSLCKSPTK